MESLVSAAIRRTGILHHGEKTHADIRRKLGDVCSYDSKRDDEEGFFTSEGRFVTRREAVPVGVRSGQLNESWLLNTRALLSSDVNWSVKKRGGGTAAALARGKRKGRV